MKNRFSVGLCVLFMGAFGAEHAQAAASTTFIASYGSDANQATNCAQAAPCRTLGGALPVTLLNGEVTVLDSAVYGRAKIAQSVSITAPDGVYAEVQGILIPGTAPGESITLKGLAFKGSGPNTNSGIFGLLVSNFSGSPVVQRCNFSGFFPPDSSGGWAISVNGNSPIGRAQVQVTDTVIHDGAAGIALISGVTASISHVKLFNLSSVGVWLQNKVSGETDVSVSDAEWSAPSLAGGTAFQVDATQSSAQLYIDHTVMTGGRSGVYATSNAGQLAYVTVINSVLSKIGTGLSTSGAAAEITFSGTTLNANSNAVSNVAGGTLMTAGNNLFIGNGSNVAGSLTQVGLQ